MDNTKSKRQIPVSATRQIGSLVFVSGQGGLDPLSGAVVGRDLESQTAQTMENISRMLSKLDLGMEDIVKVNVYLANRKDYVEFNEIYQRYFRMPFPARTAIYCELNYDLLVEIDVIAVDQNQ